MIYANGKELALNTDAEHAAPYVNPLALLSQEPETITKTRNFDGIPISYLQADLDRFFGPGNWWVENQVFTPLGHIGEDRSGSPLVGFNISIDLCVNWSQFGTGVTRYVGTYGGFVSRGNVATATAMAQGMAIKNAASKIGKRFGRDLNRALEETYTGDFQLETQSPEDKIKNAETVEELLSIFKKFNKAAQAKLKPMLAARKKEIQEAAKAKSDPNF